MLDLYDMKSQINNSVKPLLRAQEQLSLDKVLYRKLSEDILVKYDTPAFSNSAMDGYALGSTKFLNYKVKGTIYAGDINNNYSLQEDEAYRIFTGAMLPHNCQCVVMQEYCNQQDNIVSIDTKLTAYDNMRMQAEELKNNEILIKKDTILNARHIALLASQNYNSVSVYTKVKVGVLSTGSELKEVGSDISLGQIIDSNRHMLKALLQDYPELEIIDFQICKDDATLIEQTITQACNEVNCLIISGGASVGEADFVVKTIAKLGNINCHKVAIKPGKPFGLGHINQTTIIMLPGNPVSAFVTYYLLAKDVIYRLLDISNQAKNTIAIANFNYSSNNKRRIFLRVNIEYKGSLIYANYIDNQGSSMLSSCANADALLEIEPNSSISKGQQVNLYCL